MHELVKRYAAYCQSGDVKYMEPLPPPFDRYGDPRIAQELNYLWDKGYITFYQRPGRPCREYLAVETNDFED